MKKGGLVHGAWQDLRGAPRRSLVSMLGIAMGVAILLVIVGLGLGARNCRTSFFPSSMSAECKESPWNACAIGGRR